MRMVMVVYDSGIDEDVAGVLQEVGILAYTKLTGAIGVGRKGQRFGTPIWPGTNNLLWVALAEGDVAGLIERLRVLKESYLQPPALQIFAFPVDARA